ncbi:MAG TPA: GGDEF domain-containing protein [Burkholderiales bacterium]|nr:GGDEF domain-containing protein [Burkholderiales bacterium]
MFNWLADGLLIAGAGILFATLSAVRQLVKQLPLGALRRRWHVMGALIGLFIACYLAYAAVSFSGNDSWHDLIVPVVFFFGSVFVWLSITSASLTVMDLRRVALLEHETIIDPLMGIYNRRYLERRLEEEFSKASRHGTKLSAMMLDVDHFKRVNDTHGHQAGDLVLCHIGKLVLAALRNSDVATRYGGEELVILAPNTSGQEAAIFAERMRQYVETHPLVLDSEKGKREIKATISIGIAELSSGDDCNALISNADKALYHAKTKGRNRVEVHRTRQSVKGRDFSGDNPSVEMV